MAYRLEISDKTPYLKEAVTVTLDAKQRVPGGVINFEFRPVKSSAYELLFLGEEQLHDSDDLNHVRFKYALFPLQRGPITVSYIFISKKASTQEMKEVAIGARNVLRVVKTKNRTIDLGETILNVRPLPEGVELVGHYSLTVVSPPEKVLPFSQVDLSYTLKGYGYPPQMEKILPEIPGVESFVELERFDDKLFHKRRFHYALLAEKDFTVPAVAIKAFDPHKEKSYILKTAAYHVEVMPVKADEIIDAGDYPASTVSWATYRVYLYYLLFFVAGFLTAILLPLLLERFAKRGGYSSTFVENVLKAKEPRELLQLLLSKDRYRYAEEIEALEQLVYDKKDIPLKEIRQRIIKKADDGA